MSFDSFGVIPALKLFNGDFLTLNDQAEVARAQRVLTFGTLYSARNSGDIVDEFEPFARCTDALGVDAAQIQIEAGMSLNEPSFFCPKNMTKAIPASLEG